MKIRRIPFFIVICFVGILISGCNICSADSSKDSSEDIIIKCDALGPDIIILNKAAIEDKKTDYIEEKVLKKLKEILAEGKGRNDKFNTLLYESGLSLGSKTLDFLEELKLRNNEFGIKETMQIIRDRLQLVTMLQDYSPKNELEAKIINKIKFYSSDTEYSFWIDDDSRNAGSKMPSLMLKTIKLGPLRDGKYVYVKCYGPEDEFSHIGKFEWFQASAAENGCRKFSYSLGESYAIPPENQDKNKVGF